MAAVTICSDFGAPKNKVCFCFIDYTKAFDCVDHNKLWKILKDMGIPDHLTYLLRNLYAGQEATVRTGHVTTDWFQIRKGVRQACMPSPCLFNLYAEYIMRNAGLGGAQSGIKVAGRNINNIRYADDTALIAESKELKSLLMKELPYDPAIPLLGIYPEKTIVQKDTCTPMFTAALFTIVKIWIYIQ